MVTDMDKKIEVMLCEPCTVAQARELCEQYGHLIQIERKFDGIRAVFSSEGIWDRRGKEISKKFPEFVLAQLPEKLLFDAEIVANTGVFEDMSGRVHMKDRLQISLLAQKSPCRAVFFDIVPQAPKFEMLSVRRAQLESVMLPLWAKLPELYEEFDVAWSAVESGGWEGLVLKRTDSLYVGRRSSEWRKVKQWSEGRFEFTKLEETPRGVVLESKEGIRVNVNGVQAVEIRDELKKRGRVVGEVQYMKQKSDALRFPSWRGLVR
jgi:DNA ligase-1